MTETPRIRLKSLIDGLELPKGFKLTPAREEALVALGMILVKDGKVECYGPKPNHSRIHGSYAVALSASGKAALRGMVKAGWVRAEVPTAPNNGSNAHVRWTRHSVVFQPGLEQLALRLGARRTLWAERKNAPLAAARAAFEEVREQLYDVRRILNKGTYDPIVGENDVLETYRKLRALVAQETEAERMMAAAKLAVENVPEPSEDDAFAWLMERKLRGTKN